LPYAMDGVILNNQIGSSVYLAQKYKLYTMDTQTIELLLGFNEIQVEEIELKKTEIAIHCRSKFEEGVCPSCLKKCKKVKSKNVREIRDMSLLGRDVYLYLESRQFHCEDCDRYFQERFSFVEPNKAQTIRFEQYLYRSL